MKFTIMPLLTLALLLPVTPLTAVEIAATPRANSLPVTAVSRPQLAAPAAELAARAYSEEEFFQQSEHPMRASPIKVPGWFIGENACGLRYKCPGQCHALAFTA